MRPIKTWFPCAYTPLGLTQAMHHKSLDHSSIGTVSRALRASHKSQKFVKFIKSFYTLRTFNFMDFMNCVQRTPHFLVGKWFQVLFQRPHRPAFHLSLTVLVHYRSSKVFSLTRQYSQIHSRYSGLELLKKRN